MPKMNKARLAAGVSLKTGLTQVEARKVVDVACDILAIAFQEGEAVELRGFGTFQARNPRTGETVMVGPKRVVKFKLSSEIKL